MKKIIYGLIISLLLIGINNVNSQPNKIVLNSSLVSKSNSPLDRPIEKKITVRSEFKRGMDAIFQCGLNNFNSVDFKECFFNNLSKNQQANTDTDSYYLGAYYRAWIKTRIIRDITKENVGNNYYGEDLNRLQQDLEFFGKQFRKYQKQLNIDDATMSKMILDAGMVKADLPPKY